MQSHWPLATRLLHAKSPDPTSCHRGLWLSTTPATLTTHISRFDWEVDWESSRWFVRVSSPAMTEESEEIQSSLLSGSGNRILSASPGGYYSYSDQPRSESMLAPEKVRVQRAGRDKL